MDSSSSEYSDHSEEDFIEKLVEHGMDIISHDELVIERDQETNSQFLSLLNDATLTHFEITKFRSNYRLNFAQFKEFVKGDTEINEYYLNDCFNNDCTELLNIMATKELELFHFIKAEILKNECLAIVNLIKTVRTLKSFGVAILSFSNLSRVVDALCQNSNITHVDLCYNFMTRTGLVIITELFYKNNHIRYLNLGGNGHLIDQDIANLMVERLRFNTSLEEIIFEVPDGPANEAVRTIDALLDANKEFKQQKPAFKSFIHAAIPLRISTDSLDELVQRMVRFAKSQSVENE